MWNKENLHMKLGIKFEKERKTDKNLLTDNSYFFFPFLCSIYFQFTYSANAGFSGHQNVLLHTLF